MMAFTNTFFSLNTCVIFFIFLQSILNFRLSNAVKGGYFSPDNGVISSSQIDSTLFTHLFCAFASIDPQTNQISLPSGCDSFPQIVKRRNSRVQALLSIGGGTDDAGARLKAMASNPTSRKSFIDSSINVAVQNRFNGLDLDWEQQQTQDEMDNLAALLKEWRAAIKAQSATEPLLLTAALRFTATADSGVPFPAQAIADNLDWVNVMAYDFHAAKWEQPPYVTQPPASLHDPSSQTSGSSGISAWIKAGVPANRLVLGLPFYGYAWKLKNGNDNGILAPSSGGDWSLGDNGTVTYIKVKEFISKNGATCKYDSTYVTNYCYSGTSWIGFDGVETIKQKVLYAKSNAYLRGYFAWNINQDSNWILSKQAAQTWGADSG